jgi:hypothetical protein
VTTHEQVLVVTATLWSTPPWPPEAQALFLEEIREFPAADAMAAVRRFYATDPSGFRPTPGKLRALLKPKDLGAAERGWSAVRKAVDHYAGKPTHETVTMPNFADQLVTRAVESIGGFRQFLGGIDAKDLDYVRSRFLRAYGREDAEVLKLDPHHAPALSGRGVLPEQLRRLAGGGR